MRPALVALILAACAGDQRPRELGDVCAEVGGAACDRAVACGLETDAGRCRDLYLDACCGGACTAVFVFDDSQVDACVTAYEDYWCPNLSIALPVACRAIEVKDA